MPPKTRTFRVRPESLRPVASLDGDRENITPPPIMSVSVGTAGYKRSWLWAQRMGEAGVLNRVQSMFIYDCNQATTADIDGKMGNMRSARGGGDLPIILPEFFPKVDGFLRDPNAFKDFYGLIDRDLDRMLDIAQHRAEAVSAQPQIIIEWLGFGGHAKIGGLLHEKMVRAFPEATFLPILLLPREHVLEENMRRETWGAYELTMGRENDKTGGYESGPPVLLTDNRQSNRGDFRTLDDNLAIGLASIEAAVKYQTDSGSLAETVASFSDYSNGWLCMRVLSRRIDVADVPIQRSRLSPRSWFGGLGNRQTAIIKGKDNHLTWQIKDALWEIADTGKRSDLQMALHDPIDDESVMRIVVTLPADNDGLRQIEEDVRDQLERENFDDAFPNMTYSFAPAHFPGASNDHKMYVSMFYPLRRPGVESIQRIMGRSGEFGRLSDDAATTNIGFGTGLCMDNLGDLNRQRDLQLQYGYQSRGSLRRLEREAARAAARNGASADMAYSNGYNGSRENGYR